MVRPNRRASISGSAPGVIHTSRRRASTVAAAVTDDVAAGMRPQRARTASIDTAAAPRPARGVRAEASGHQRKPARPLSRTTRSRDESTPPGPSPTRTAPRDPAAAAAASTSSVSAEVETPKASVCSSTYAGTSLPRTTVNGTARCRAVSAATASAAVAAVPWANATTARGDIGSGKRRGARTHSCAA